MPGAPDPYASFRLNLEQQRKRAKDLIRAARAGDRDALSRLHAATGGRVSGGDAKLADAQFAVARELGLPSWRDLRRHIEALTAARAAIAHTPAPDGRTSTLHVRCGSDIQQELVRAGFTGDFLSLWDSFPIGPVTAGADWIRARARFLADGVIDLPYEELLRELTEAEERLAASAGRYERIVLWMEHDSHDQLSLIRCLASYARIGPPKVLELISIDHFPGSSRFIGLGQLPPEAMRMLWRRREAVGSDGLALAADVWAALTSDDPRRLATLTQMDTRALPHLAPALHRHLRELPSMRNGLSLTEQLTLQMLDERPMTMGELFRTLHAQREPLPFLGDTMFLHIVSDMGRAAQAVFVREHADHWFRDRLSITDVGRDVLRGTTDWLSLLPPPRWVGGVRIDAAGANWRWDEERLEVARHDPRRSAVSSG
jgi:Domain of unknown function (DUF1835)